MNDIQKSLPATDKEKATIADTDTEKQLIPLLKPSSKSHPVDPVVTKQPAEKKHPGEDSDMAITCCQCLACCGEFLNECVMVVCCCYVLHSQ